MREARTQRGSGHSDNFEIRLADDMPLRGCFALWKRTRHILGLTFDYNMAASLVVGSIQMVSFDVPGAIWHSDQGKHYGAEATRKALLEKGFKRSMNLCKLAGADRQTYRALGDILRAAEQRVRFYTTTQPMKAWVIAPPITMSWSRAWKEFLL